MMSRYHFKKSLAAKFSDATKWDKKSRPAKISLIIVLFLLISCKSAPVTTQEKIIQKNDFKIESVLQQDTTFEQVKVQIYDTNRVLLKDTIHSHVLRFDTIINVYNKPVDISTNYDLLSNKWGLDFTPASPDTTIIYKTEEVPDRLSMILHFFAIVAIASAICLIATRKDKD